MTVPIATVTDPAKFVAEGVFREFTYLTDLIKMYRTLQLQAVGLCLTAYAAAMALIGAALGKAPGPNGNETSAPALEFVGATTALVLPYFALLALLAYSTMEVRIRRSSLYIVRDLAPLADKLSQGFPASGQLLRYEDNPSKHIWRPTRILSSSTAFAALIGVPAVAAGWWYSNYAPQLAWAATYPTLGAIGTCLCAAATVVTAGYSLFHECRLFVKEKASAEESPQAAGSPAGAGGGQSAADGSGQEV